MKTKDRIRKSVLLLFCLSISFILSACGKQDLQVVIIDGMEETKVAVSHGETVAEAIEQAGISINDKDVITPEKTTALTKETQINISRYAKVTVTEGESTTELELTGKKVKDVLAKLDISLDENDYINHNWDTYLTNGMQIDVIHRIAVTISVDGEKKQCLTKANNVDMLLAEQHISLDKKDRISPARKATLNEGTTVLVKRVSVKEIKEFEPITFETQFEYSSSMYEDESVEKTPGILGEKEVIYQVTYVDGKEEKRTILKETVIKEPVSQVVVKGTKARRRIISKQKVADCDGSDHGYYIITWSDGTVEYVDY